MINVEDVGGFPSVGEMPATVEGTEEHCGGFVSQPGAQCLVDFWGLEPAA